MVPSARTRLVGRARRGGIALVVGAGASLSRGVPNWESLAKRMWREAFGKEPSPWEAADTGRSPRETSQFLPIIFELAYRKLGEGAFLEALRKHLYSNVSYPGDDKRFKRSNESLAVLARVILQEYKRASKRRIDAVITLNADDLIEQAVSAVAGFKRPPSPREEIVRVFARSTHSHLGGPLRRPIPVYHIHGFVPSNHFTRYGEFFDHMLVFTDTQYWSTSAAAATFANRVIASALGEGCCIFVGLSMTDINLLRWLAIRTIERDRDVQAIENLPRSGPSRQIIGNIFQRHYWIRPASDDPTGFVSEFLKLRGLESVAIDSWASEGLQELIKDCFPAS